MAWRSAWRMNGSPERATRRFRMPAGPAPLSSPSLTTRPVSIRPEGGGVDEQAVGGAQVLLPVPSADLLGDQRVGGVLVGDAQQRLGEAHQDDAFLRGQPVLVHEGVDAAVLGRGWRAPPAPAGPPARRCAGAPSAVAMARSTRPATTSARPSGSWRDLVAGRHRTSSLPSSAMRICHPPTARSSSRALPALALARVVTGIQPSAVAAARGDGSRRQLRDDNRGLAYR